MRNSLMRALASMTSTLLVLAAIVALMNAGWGRLQAEPLLGATPYYEMPVA